MQFAVSFAFSWVLLFFFISKANAMEKACIILYVPNSLPHPLNLASHLPASFTGPDHIHTSCLSQSLTVTAVLQLARGGGGGTIFRLISYMFLLFTVWIEYTPGKKYFTQKRADATSTNPWHVSSNIWKSLHATGNLLVKELNKWMPPFNKMWKKEIKHNFHIAGNRKIRAPKYETGISMPNSVSVSLTIFRQGPELILIL